VVAVVATVAVAGCSQPEPTRAAQVEPGRGEQVEASQVSTPAPGGSCGHLEGRDAILLVTAPDLAPPDEIACMRAALAEHRTADVTISMPTVEGDPVHQTFRLDPSGQVALTIDASEDRFHGSGSGVSGVACVKPSWLPGAVCPALPPPATRPATWSLAPDQAPITPTTIMIEVLVHPVWCTGDATGEVLEPRVQQRSNAVEVTFRVSNRPRSHTSPCRGVAPIAYRVDLGRQLKDRWVVDGACYLPSISWRSACTESKVRARA
jgi:hypothetical protein